MTFTAAPLTPMTAGAPPPAATVVSTPLTLAAVPVPAHIHTHALGLKFALATSLGPDPPDTPTGK